MRKKSGKFDLFLRGRRGGGETWKTDYAVAILSVLQSHKLLQLGHHEVHGRSVHVKNPAILSSKM